MRCNDDKLSVRLFDSFTTTPVADVFWLIIWLNIFFNCTVPEEPNVKSYISLFHCHCCRGDTTVPPSGVCGRLPDRTVSDKSVPQFSSEAEVSKQQQLYMDYKLTPSFRCSSTAENTQQMFWMKVSILFIGFPHSSSGSGCFSSASCSIMCQILQTANGQKSVPRKR